MAITAAKKPISISVRSIDEKGKLIVIGQK